DTVTVEQRHYLLSGAGGAAAFGQAVRSHWGIENRVHWVLDVTFGEDDCRVREGHSPQNFAVLRHLALNLLRQERTRKGSLPTKRFTAALDDAYRATVLAGVADEHAHVPP
ncbi:MAG TPA: ISAs1 family transposase, partial [Herpetosiphonaceae bacterium]|nr:ISAs1 family transposase [Herpetosiphonaceae bacterium]